MKKNTSERGQVLVLVVLGLVLILAFAGLAIDGGRIYSDRRNGQNGADAASLAGGGEAASYLEANGIYSNPWDCGSTSLQTAMVLAINTAISRAQSNGFTIDNDFDADWNGVETRCESRAFNNGAFVDRYIDVITRITTHTQPVFIQFFYPDVVDNQVEAVTRVRPRQPLAYGNAIVALNPAACQGNKNGIQVGGSLTLKIRGGGMFSNGCLGGDGANYTAMIQDGNVSYVADLAGKMNFTDENGNPISVQDADTRIPDDAISIPLPDCNSPAVTLSKITSSMDLAPGLYCITGDPNNTNKQAIKLTAHDYLKGDGVTIYILNGGIEIAGGADIQLKAPGENPVNNAIPGVLFYVESDGKSVDLSGNSDSVMAGLIYAPNAYVTLTGSSTMGTPVTFSTQLIAYDVSLRGNLYMDITYQSEKNYNKPTSMELAK